MRFSFFILLIIVSSCTTPSKNDSKVKSRNDSVIQNDPEAKKTATLFGTSDYEVEYDSVSTTDGNKNVVELILKNVKVLPIKTEQNKLNSIVALKFFDAMSVNRRKKYDFFKIKIINKDASFEGSYYTNDIAWASLLSTDIRGFFSQQETNTSFLVLDPRFFPDSIHYKIRYLVSNLLTENSYKTFKITGFATDTLKDTGEPVIVYSVETQGKERMVEFTFFVAEHTSQIVHLNIN